ncbi:glycosyl transferase family 2 [Microbacterium sp. AG1240]|uniref:glycosyltransferase family A protein n=1 Tax=Microbacterium sp. AG1240 TaxID=2183992 RepID=UPI000F2AC442|nr:glycosyltransferase family A protein [Microbacterium sp. AG1240]RKT31228.1 glycosyl transferase family 2 [Microbacterium sp. AG1240]
MTTIPERRSPRASSVYVTVSVVIPVKDDAVALARCLTALAGQTRLADETIVVDNGSVDASAEVARRAGARVVPCVRPGIPAASALGYDAATGEIILRLDADCVPDATWIEMVLSAFSRQPHVAAFTGGARFIDGPRMLRRPLAFAYLLAYILVTAPALGHLPLFGSNVALRREAWIDVRSAVHRHDAMLHDDVDLAFHLGERHRIGRLPTAAMGMSMRPFSSLSGFRRRIDRGFRTVTVHWPHDFPPHRWVRVALNRATARRGRAVPVRAR